VFVDTSAYVAVAIRGDENHRQAVLTLRALTERRSRLYTTNFVAAETHAFVLARGGRDLALQTLGLIDHGFEEVIRVGADDERQAREVLSRYRDKDFSLVDAMSFTVMSRLGITAAFAFDRHFVQHGFTLIDES
jgi:predicted nucleic acid-binding protein